jgi:phosphate transport system protein
LDKGCDKKMTRTVFENELQEIYINMLKMASLIEKSIDEMIKALMNNDKDIAKEIIKRDDEVDELDKYLTEKCIFIILTQQPVAVDLRKIIASFKMVTDLERIADHCEDISMYILKIDKPIDESVLNNIKAMALLVKDMVHNIIDCFVDIDFQKAEEIAKNDDKVDMLFENIIESIEKTIEKEKENIHELISYIFIVKYLERMADHVTNVSEWIRYQKTGEIDLHHNK